MTSLRPTQQVHCITTTVHKTRVISKVHEPSFILSGFERTTVRPVSVWNNCEAGERLGRSRFRVRVIIQTITHREKGGSGHWGWGVLLFDSRPMARVCGRAGEREGVRVLTVKWWAVLVYRWATAGRVRVAGSLPALARLLPVCPPRPASRLTILIFWVYLCAHFNP